METAKVDIRKLQLLNDRINQTMEALNQVRLSVYGISHTGPFGQIPGQMFGQVPGIGFGGAMQNPYFAAVQGGPVGVPPGFSHSTGVNPMAYGLSPLIPQMLGPQMLGQQQLGQWGPPQVPMGAFGQQGIPAGLGHTSPEAPEQSWYARGLDPNAGRIGQTFPFVQWGFSPFGQGYSPYGSGVF